MYTRTPMKKRTLRAYTVLPPDMLPRSVRKENLCTEEKDLYGCPSLRAYYQARAPVGAQLQGFGGKYFPVTPWLPRYDRLSRNRWPSAWEAIMEPFSPPGHFLPGHLVIHLGTSSPLHPRLFPEDQRPRPMDWPGAPEVYAWCLGATLDRREEALVRWFLQRLVQDPRGAMLLMGTDPTELRTSIHPKLGFLERMRCRLEIGNQPLIFHEDALPWIIDYRDLEVEALYKRPRYPVRHHLALSCPDPEIISMCRSVRLRSVQARGSLGEDILAYLRDPPNLLPGDGLIDGDHGVG